MPSSLDPKYLLTDQYHDAANLSARNDLHIRFSKNKYGWRKWVFDRILAANLPPDAHILEVGGGPGWLWRDNLDRIPAGWNIILSDFSPGMVALARQGLGGNGRSFRFETVDIQSIPYGDERFDAVIANHMLYHVPDRPSAFLEVRRVLKPGGRFFAATNGIKHLCELDDISHQFDPALDFWAGFSTHAFNLEDGARQLSPFFSRIGMQRYVDGLVVTDAEAIVAYLLSGAARDVLTGARLEQFKAFVAQIIAKEGALQITKDSGLFEAVL